MCRTKIAWLCAGWLFLAAGCQQKMAEQPRYEPLEASRFFADGQSARPLVPGTVPRGEFRDDPHFSTGMNPVGAEEGLSERPRLDQTERYVEEFPYPVSIAMMRRGQQRYQIFCAPCHGPHGSGLGRIVRDGFPRAASFHTERLRQAPVGYLFDVITRGQGQMPPFAGQVAPRDRWAIIAYVRALQFSYQAELSQLPDDLQRRFAQEDHPSPADADTMR